MSQLYISPSEMQFGVQNSFVAQAGLSDITTGTDNLVVEILLRKHAADTAYIRKLAANDRPYYCIWAEAAWAHWILITTRYNAGNPQIYIQLWDGFVNVINEYIEIHNIYKDVLHLILVIRDASFVILINGHQARGGNKVAHNLNLTRNTFFANTIVGGIATPSIGCIMKYYTGDLSGISSAQMLAIHRKYLRHPFVRIPELGPYLKFAWEGRQADTAPGVIGPQILAGCTYLENAINGEHLALAAPNNTWGSVRAQIWQPR